VSGSRATYQEALHETLRHGRRHPDASDTVGFSALVVVTSNIPVAA
jgi:hypothetical protein